MEENKNTEPEHKSESIPEETIPPNETIKPEAEALATKEPFSNINAQVQIKENMEVHHHGHVHEKKKWKEYLFQFIMLFLAVFCGFLAENQREHYIEHQRARVLAQSLVEDLKKDTSSLVITISQCDQKIKNLKELVKLLRQPPPTRNDTLIYKNALLIQYATRFLRASGTYNQIVNSGSLRYFNQKLVNLMNQYDINIRMVEGRRDADLNIIFNTSLTFINKNLNQEVFDEVLENKPVTKTLYNKFDSPDQLNELINHAIVSRRITERMKIESETALKSGRDLIFAINKKYNIK